jgi:hypothetical protein
MFTVVDVYYLMKERKNRHPSLKDINELIIALKNDIGVFETIFRIINNQVETKYLLMNIKIKLFEILSEPKFIFKLTKSIVNFIEF